MNERVRIYGDTLRTWTSIEEYTFRGEQKEREVIVQRELEYKEYDLDGNLLATGSEDFSTERYREIDSQWLWTWDGNKRNKGGHRWFDCLGLVKFNINTKREALVLMKALHKDAAVVQLRTF